MLDEMELLETNGPERVIFQYSDRCNMDCAFCYCPFINQRVDNALSVAIVERCSKLGVKAITFGGGDPFMYESFRDLIVHAHSLGLTVHVDTNGISMHESDYQLISDNVSLLSLPLDGPDEKVNAEMRGQAGHFDLVLSHLTKMAGVSCKLKINTVVASINARHMHKLALLLSKYPIVSFWSLFQFWPLGYGATNRALFEISESDYNDLITQIKLLTLPFTIEAGPFSGRRGHHFFVTHTGKVYIHSEDDISAYRDLGSIFDDRVIEKWGDLVPSSIHPVSAIRYNRLMRERLEN